MRARFVTAIIAIVMLVAALDAHAARRSLRVAFGEDWGDALPLGPPDCPGAAGIVADVLRLGMQFSGDQGSTFVVDTYCQVAAPFVEGETGEFSYLNEVVIPPDEAGLAAKIGSNTNNAVTAIRYTFLDCDRFNCIDIEGREPDGFQWAFYFFPGNITIVALYGLQGVPLSTNHHFIYDFSLGVDHWNGERDGFDGEYFCFDSNEFIGVWDGNPVSGGPAAGCVIPEPPKREIINCGGFEDIYIPPGELGFCGQFDEESEF